MTFFNNKLRKVTVAVLAGLVSPNLALAGHGFGIGGGGMIGGGGGGGGGRSIVGRVLPGRSSGGNNGYGNNGNGNNGYGNRGPVTNQNPYNNPQPVKTYPTQPNNTNKVITNNQQPQGHPHQPNTNSSAGKVTTPQTGGVQTQQGQKPDLMSRIGAKNHEHQGTKVAQPAGTAAPQNTQVGKTSQTPGAGNVQKGGVVSQGKGSDVLKKTAGNGKPMPKPGQNPPGPGQNPPQQANDHHPHHHHWGHGGAWVPVVIGFGAAGAGYGYNNAGGGYTGGYSTVVSTTPDGSVPVTTTATNAAPAPMPTTGPADTTPAVPAPTNPAPAPAGQVAAADSQVAAAQPTEGVDLILEAIQMVEQGDESTGPSYRVKFRNQGTQPAAAFRVAAFAELDGNLTDEISRDVQDVAGLGPGESGEVTLRLPATALKMLKNKDAEPAVFNQLAVAIDIDSTVTELDKNNNMATLEAGALRVAAK